MKTIYCPDCGSDTMIIDSSSGDWAYICTKCRKIIKV